MNRLSTFSLVFIFSLAFLGLIQVPVIQAISTEISEVAPTAVYGSYARIIWVTNVPSSSRVAYGTASGAYIHSSTDLCDGVENSSYFHCIELANLSPNITYYYKVESGVDGLAATSSEFQFYTGSSATTSTSSNPEDADLSESSGTSGSLTAEETSTETSTSSITTYYPAPAESTHESISVSPIIPYEGSTISRASELRATSSPGTARLYFIIVKNNSILQKVEARAATSNEWIYMLDTTRIPNGSYNLVAQAVMSSGEVIGSSFRNFHIYNPIATPVEDPVVITRPLPLQPAPITTQPSPIASETVAITTIEGTPLVSWECQQAQITDSVKCAEFLFLRSLPRECREQGIKSAAECDKVMEVLYLPGACREAGILDPSECKIRLESLELPAECHAVGIHGAEECTRFVYEKNAPQSCLNAGISNKEDCEAFVFKLNLPTDCLREGVTSPEACKRLIVEKYGNREDLPPDQYPLECKKAGTRTADECRSLLEKEYTPIECRNEGLISGRECAVYLAQKHLPNECRTLGIANHETCNNVLFKKYSPQECQLSGIATETGCREFFIEKYKARVTCQATQSECDASVAKNLGSLAAVQQIYKDVKAQEEILANNSLSLQEVAEKVTGIGALLPLGEGKIRIRSLKAEEGIVFKRDGTLLQTSPVVWIADSDGDGLSDDIEQRIGTNPNSHDSDNDGANDRDELNKKENPLGTGSIALALAPIESAIINDVSLEHPKVSGLVSSALKIEAVANNSSVPGDAGYLFRGKAEPDTVVTLYIYSEMPMVVTVRADRYGNWQYEFGEALRDGEHEMYVAVNDNTGKVIKKSNSFNFFVQEAQAFSVNDFVAATLPTQQQSDQSALNFYLLAVAASIIIAIMLLAIVIIYRKKIAVEPQDHAT